MDARTAALMGQKPNVDLRRITPQRVSGSLGAASMALPSPIGDVAGLLADGIGYAGNPQSFTPGAGLLSLAGLVPGVPRVPKKAGWFSSDLVSEFVADAAKYAPPDSPMSAKEWGEMFEAYHWKAYDGKKLPAALARVKKSLRNGDLADELNAYKASFDVPDTSVAEAAWKQLAAKAGIE
jgi:hypothetical protein